MPLSVIFHSRCHPLFFSIYLAFLFLYFCPPLSLHFLWAQRVGRPPATEAAVW